jgi:hypothetical protein
MHVAAAMMIALCGGGGSAAAQEPDVIYFARGVSDSGNGQVGSAGAVRQIQGAGGQDVTFEMPIDVLAAEPLDVGKPVTGAPYSADVTTEIVQQLADGNRIERRSTSSVARDGEGRVRREQQVTAIGPILPSRNAQIVTINDPVAKVHYSLDTERKVAIQLPMPFAAKFVGAGPDRTFFVARTEKGDLMPPPLVGARQAPDARTETLGTKEIEGWSHWQSRPYRDRQRTLVLAGAPDGRPFAALGPSLW